MKVFESLITRAFKYYQQIYFDMDLNLLCLIFFNKKRRSKTHNYYCHSKKFPLCQSEKFVWPIRLSLVAILQSSVDGTILDCNSICVADTNSVGDIFFQLHD